MSAIFEQLNSVAGIVLAVIALVGYFGMGVLAWSNMRWRVTNLEGRHDALQDIVSKQLDITREVELNSRELKQISKATERRLQMLEDGKA